MNSDDTPMTDAEAAFERHARELFAAGSETLDGRTRSRLTAARFAALGELERRAAAPLFRVPGRWLPAGAVAAALVLGVARLVPRPTGGPAAGAAPPAPGGRAW